MSTIDRIGGKSRSFVRLKGKICKKTFRTTGLRPNGCSAETCDCLAMGCSLYSHIFTWYCK